MKKIEEKAPRDIVQEYLDKQKKKNEALAKEFIEYLKKKQKET